MYLISLQQVALESLIQRLLRSLNIQIDGPVLIRNCSSLFFLPKVSACDLVVASVPAGCLKTLISFFT